MPQNGEESKCSGNFLAAPPFVVFVDDQAPKYEHKNYAVSWQVVPKILPELIDR